MGSRPPLRFGVIGIDHRHIYDQVASLLGIGAECAGFWTHDGDVRTLKGFVERFPTIPRVDDHQRLLDEDFQQVFQAWLVFRLGLAALQLTVEAGAERPQEA